MILRASIAPALAAACAAAAFVVGPPRGAIAELYGRPGLQGPRLLHRIVPAIDPGLIVRDPAAPREMFSARWTTAWRVVREGDYTIEASADDRVRITIDGRVVIAPSGEEVIQRSTATLRLQPGFHRVSVEYEQVDGGMFLGTVVSQGGAAEEPWPGRSGFAIDDPAHALRDVWIARILWTAAALAFIAACWRMISQKRAPSAAVLTAACLTVILVWAGALRLDALLGRAGPLDRPGWLHALDAHARLPLSRVAPATFQWVHPPRMFQQGDPAAYLFFARQMRSFYAAHPREPLFIGLTRALLPATAQQDIAVGLASALSSWLLVAAAFALGATIASRPAGLVAALALAIEHDAIEWGVEGWRDDLFAALFVVFACLAIRLHRRVDMRTALAIGVVSAGLLLTRVTAVSFIGAAAAVLIAARLRSAGLRRPSPHALRSLALGSLVGVVLAAPFFINSYRAFGNPLHAIDVNTGFYRTREGAEATRPLSAVAYVTGRIKEHPVRLTRTAVTGMTTYPFLNKWRGLEHWIPGLGRVAAALALAGLVLLAFRGSGRLLLVIIAASMLPYIFTHDIPGGAEWRFTLHVYPVLLVAAALALERIGAALWSWRETPRALVTSVRAHRTALAAAAVAVLVVWLAARVWPYLEVAEDAWFGRSYSIAADAAHAWLFSDEWAGPVKAGNVISRSSSGPSGTVWLPLAHKRTHHMRLRLDPVPAETGGGTELRIYVNRHLLSTQAVQVVEGRVGAYDVVVPGAVVNRGLNRLDLLITRNDPRETSEPDRIRLWYVRLTAM